VKTGPGYLPPREPYRPRFELAYQCMPSILKFEQFKVKYDPAPMPEGLTRRPDPRKLVEAVLNDKDHPWSKLVRSSHVSSHHYQE
jgi:hypothetical protein